jgi:Tol biopolymer transport system component
MKQITLILVAILLAGINSYSQKTNFTPQDVLDVKSLSIVDMNDDGSLIIGSIRSRRDRMNIDHSRYGDPNYVTPSGSKLVLINTETGIEKTIIPEGSITGRAKFSPSGNELAYIIYEDTDFKLYIYNITNSKSRQVKIKSDLKISSGSGLDWTTNGEELLSD